MKKILLVSKKETIEISYPDWLSDFMNIVSPHLKAKTIRLSNGSKIKTMYIDEFKQK